MRRALIFAGVLALLSVGMVNCSGARHFAWAHGWYDMACCGDGDCAPLPSNAKIEMTGGGYRVTVPGGEAVDFRRDQVRASQDMQFHGCVAGGVPICLYVPGSV